MDRERALRRIRDLEKKISLVSKILENMREGVIIFDDEGVIRTANRSFLEITGLSYDLLYGRQISSLDLRWEGSPTFSEVFDLLKEEGAWRGEVWGVHRSGTIFTCEVTLLRVGSEFLGLFLDTTDKRSLEANLRSLAYYDTLTGLPNRALLYDHLAYTLFRSKMRNEKVGVIFMDIDNFKLINDTLGHEVGDTLLKAFSQRVTSSFPPGTMVARFGGDEFVVVVGPIGDIENLKETMEDLIRNLTTPFHIGGHRIYVTVTAGISIYPMDGGDPQTLLRNADIAMHHAKETGRSTYKFYTADLNIKVSERFTLESELREAIEREEFVLYYQPQFDLATDRVTGVEALVRWHHPDRGLILPSRFIHIAEEVDLIVPLGRWILRRACFDGKRLLREGYPLKVAVNISPNQISAGNFTEVLKEILRETDFDPTFLEVEITENALMKNKQEAARVLSELKAMGVTVSIDDFGTSYSSLNYLKYFPVDKLKIDRSFIGDIVSDPNDVAIATTIIAIAHNLGLKAIAEGVETEEQLIFLRLWQCDEAQGFYFSPPVTLESLIDMLRRESFKIRGV